MAGALNMTEAVLHNFVDAVEADGGLEIITVTDDDCFVIQNNNMEVGVEGHQVEVPVTEIVRANTIERLNRLIDVVKGLRNSVVCHGVTRIVGYYSRTHNWNRSKIGELRDRAKGKYGVPNYNPKYQEDRMEAINRLSCV